MRHATAQLRVQESARRLVERAGIKFRELRKFSLCAARERAHRLDVARRMNFRRRSERYLIYVRLLWRSRADPLSGPRVSPGAGENDKKYLRARKTSPRSEADGERRRNALYTLIAPPGVR